jgi:hypothetical protein
LLLNPAEVNGLLKAIRIHSINSFGGKIKLSVPCRKISRHVKNPFGMAEILRRKLKGYFSPNFSLLPYEVSLLVFAREFWWMNRE